MNKRELLQKMVNGQLSKKEATTIIKKRKRCRYVCDVIPQGDKFKLIFGKDHYEIMTKEQMENDKSLYFPTKGSPEDIISDPIE